MKKIEDGGEWLRRARMWLQRNAAGGDRVIWGSGDLVTLSVRLLEEMAQEAVRGYHDSLTAEGRILSDEDLKRAQESQRRPLTEITNDTPDVLKTPSWWVRCRDEGETWEMAQQVYASSAEGAVGQWAEKPDNDYELVVKERTLHVEVVSHEDYLALINVEKPEDLIVRRRYEVHGRFESVYYIKEK